MSVGSVLKRLIINVVGVCGKRVLVVVTHIEQVLWRESPPLCFGIGYFANQLQQSEAAISIQ